MSAVKQPIHGRVVQPEWLDSLPPNDPQAIRSRRDLRRLNRWMRNPSHVLDAINNLRQKPTTIIEVGSGDGTFMLSLARRLKWKHRVRLTLLDMQPVISPATLETLQRLGWDAEVRAEKLQDWLAGPEAPMADLILANLFWHHFQDAELRDFFASLSRITRAFVACEPRRWMPARVATRLLWLIGCNLTTRHDARISVEAGFRDHELSALWPSGSDLTLTEFPAGYASHLFIAQTQIASMPKAGLISH
jgi:hypothetical protein